MRRFIFVTLLIWVLTEKCLEGNFQLRHLLNEDTLFMSLQRSAIKDVNDWDLCTTYNLWCTKHNWSEEQEYKIPQKFQMLQMWQSDIHCNWFSWKCSKWSFSFLNPNLKKIFLLQFQFLWFYDKMYHQFWQPQLK